MAKKVDKYIRTEVLVTIHKPAKGAVICRVDQLQLGADRDQLAASVVAELAAAGAEIVSIATMSCVTDLESGYTSGGANDITERIVGRALAKALANDEIIKLGTSQLLDQEGHSYQATFCADRESYCADLYIHLDRPMESGLYDDETFMANALKALESFGYPGPGFGRAELGMQADRCVACETPREFSDWLKQFGYIDLNERDEELENG